jgi:predicted phosphodiesterase
MNIVSSKSYIFLLIYSLIFFLSIDLLLGSAPEYENKHEKRYYAYATSITAILRDFNFAAAGDWGCNSNTNKTISSIQSKNPELVLGLGDYSYKNTAGCWLQMIDPIEEKMKIVIGGHDSESLSLLNQYMSHFNLTKQYYSFDYQNVHFIAMSTELPWDKSSAQYKFVKEDLLKASIDPNIDWIVVFYHDLAYTSPSVKDAKSSLQDTYHPLFDRYNVDLVLQAHQHNYQRTYPLNYNSDSPSNPIETSNNTDTYNDPSGQIYATVGTGGVSITDGESQTEPLFDSGEALYDFKKKASFVVTQFKGYGFLNIDVKNNGTTFDAVFYANDGTIKDRFMIAK